MYLYFGRRELHALVVLSSSSPRSAGLGSREMVEVVRHTVLLLLQLFVGLLLLCSYKPQAEPRNWKEILVPLAASFFFLFYNAVPQLPEPLRRTLFPAAVQAPCTVFALVLGIIGPAISMWGVMSLG